MPHIALIGDSVFDNGSYTGGEPDVVTHLRNLLPRPWEVSLHAVDGSTTADLPLQLRHVASSATHLVVSIGGNDALMNSDLLALPVESTTAALHLFADRAERFEAGFREAVRQALRLSLPTTLCTIYNGNLEPEWSRPARLALTPFNDVILRVSSELGLDLIDLRLVCTEAADYANPIEPSGRGGRKIARAVAQAAGALPASPIRVFSARD